MKGLEKFIAPLKRRVMGMIVRGVVTAFKENGGGNLLMQMTLLAEETADGLELIQDFGFVSKPKVGAEGVVIFPSGDKAHGLIIATGDRRYRLTVADGEVAIHDANGTKVHLKAGGNIEMVASAKVTITSPLVEASGDLHAIGNLTVGGTSTLTGAVTAGATVVAAGVVTGASINSVAAGVGDVGAKINELKAKHNAHKHTETGTITAVPDLQVA